MASNLHVHDVVDQGPLVCCYIQPQKSLGYYIQVKYITNSAVSVPK